MSVPREPRIGGAAVDTPQPPVRVGICCMAKKLNSKSMGELLTRIDGLGVYDFVRLDDAVILHQPVDQWPVVDSCIPFYSDGFPIDKAIEYASLHRGTMYCVTDPSYQRVLLDRRSVYAALNHNNVPTCRHVAVSRDGWVGPHGAPSTSLPNATELTEEGDDHIVVGGITLVKPFVEKPVDAEDHNVRIYHHTKDGGGCTFLFRKVGNKSSERHPDVRRVRRDGSYVYEEFAATVGMRDVKVYAVGRSYAFAESRKSPVVDGNVDRDTSGKEMRVVEQLSEDERVMAQKIVSIFRQEVCGFDLLRLPDGRSRVCDVNGWSFVKNTTEYFDSAAKLLHHIFQSEYRARGLMRAVIPNAQRRLIGVVGLVRHADRSPKHKVSLVVHDNEVADCVLGSCEGNGATVVVSRGGSVLNTSVLPHLKRLAAAAELRVGSPASRSDSTAEDEADDDVGSSTMDSHLWQKLDRVVSVIEAERRGLKIRYTVTTPSTPAEHGGKEEQKLVRISCKWGGWVTDGGCLQAGRLGRRFAETMLNLPPYLVDCRKISARCQNEGRVKKTARELVGGILDSSCRCGSHHGLGQPNPTNPRMPSDANQVHTDDNLFRLSRAAVSVRKELKGSWLNEVLHIDDPSVLFDATGAPAASSREDGHALQHLARTILAINGEPVAPATLLRRVHRMVLDLAMIDESMLHKPNPALYEGESLAAFQQRWATVAQSFYDPSTGRFNTNMVPDLFEYVSFDVCYNQEELSPTDFYMLFSATEQLSNFAGEYDYGCTEQRLSASHVAAAPVLDAVRTDIVTMKHAEDGSGAYSPCTASPHREPRTKDEAAKGAAFPSMTSSLSMSIMPRGGVAVKLYVVHKAVVKAVRDLLYSSPQVRLPFHRAKDTMEMNFLSSLMFKVYTYDAPSTSLAPTQQQELQIELWWSPGVDVNVFGVTPGMDTVRGISAPIRIHNALTIDDLTAILGDQRSPPVLPR